MLKTSRFRGQIRDGSGIYRPMPSQYLVPYRSRWADDSRAMTNKGLRGLRAMGRRPAITRLTTLLAVLLLAAPFAAEAQPAGPEVRTVGVLTPHREDPAYPVFFETLRQLGYHEDRSLRLLVRSAEWKHDRLPALAAELVEA